MDLHGWQAGLLGIVVNQPHNFIYAKEYFTALATAGSSRKPWGQQVEFQLTINNLLDYDEPVYLGTRVLANVAISNYFSYVAPRMGSLTATVRF